MGILRNLATKIIKDTLVLCGINTVAKTVDKHNQRQREAVKKREKRIVKRFKTISFLSKYKKQLLAICHEEDGARTYVFSDANNQDLYYTSFSKKLSGLLLNDNDKNIIGSVIFGKPIKSGLLLNKKFSCELSIDIGNSQLGTVNLSAEKKTKSIYINTSFCEIWVKNKDNTIEVENEFKISPMKFFAKNAYQIEYNSEDKRIIMVLTFIAINEAKCILKEIK